MLKLNVDHRKTLYPHHVYAFAVRQKHMAPRTNENRTPTSVLQCTNTQNERMETGVEQTINKTS